MAATLVQLEDVSVHFGARTVLADLSLGVLDGARVGVVGRNGSGKSTLLGVLDGSVEARSGRMSARSGLRVGRLGQSDTLDAMATVRESILGNRADHDWAGDARIRGILEGLLGGLDAPSLTNGLATLVGLTSGGERRRIALTALLVADPDLLLLDEPTNHLDLSAINWLAGHLRDRRGSLVVVTHDRWFLDEVCDETWEVAATTVHRYDGGYAAYVLARAERERRASVASVKRNSLLRKELAWLRRGAPARTSKPKFRLDAAAELIADEPPPRDRLELQRTASARLGNQVLEIEDVVLQLPGTPRLLDQVTWRVGPGDRIGLLGDNGAGKTSLLRLLLGQLHPSQGRVVVGRTVVPALLAQELEDLAGDKRVLESVTELRGEIEVGGGRTLSATALLEGFGFTGGRIDARVGDLSGGERRRLQVLRLLLAGPNVLLLDEPTNDLDVETLAVLEDLLDSWAGTVIVVSHDRYFLERVCDSIFLLRAGQVRHLPGGVEEYLSAAVAPKTGAKSKPTHGTPKAQRQDAKELRKEIARIERTIARLDEQEAKFHHAMAQAAADHHRVAELARELQALTSLRAELEEQWLVLSDDPG